MVSEPLRSCRASGDAEPEGAVHEMLSARGAFTRTDNGGRATAKRGSNTGIRSVTRRMHLGVAQKRGLVGRAALPLFGAGNGAAYTAATAAGRLRLWGWRVPGRPTGSTASFRRIPRPRGGRRRRRSGNSSGKCGRRWRHCANPSPGNTRQQELRASRCRLADLSKRH